MGAEGRRVADRRGECAIYALVCVCIGLAWQFLTVHYNFGGNWTALYISGSYFHIPPALASENIYVFPNSTGYDGQLYHYVAHDPLMQRGFGQFMDNARFRYRRILLPATAFVLAGGRQSAIDVAYIAANLLFLFLGAWWIGRYLAISGQSPVLALLFVLVPAVLTSLDRLTVDLSFTALCMGFAFFARIEARWRLYAVLVLATLSRETGLVPTISFCVFCLAQHRFVQAALYSTAALPAGLWYLFVNSRTPDPGGHWTSVIPIDQWSHLIPLRGILYALLHPIQYPVSPLVNGGIRTFDYMALAGIVMACVLAFYILYKKPFGYIEIAAALWAAGALCLPYGIWVDCCSSGRVFSSLMIFLILRNTAHPAILWALPLILVSMRTWLQMVSPLLGIVRGLLHHWQ